jgi:gliding motility-associated-like protein
MEHSNTSNLKIELKCPDGKSVILKNYGGPDKYFGVPVDDEGSNLAGTGYQYTWSNNSSFGSINTITPSGTTYQAGSYAPEQPFSNLIGCPLNGIWELTVTDNQNLDNGFAFAAQMQFDPAILPLKWEFNNSYSSPNWFGSGVSSTSGSGLATAIPQLTGGINYSFRVKDNYGCTQDTSKILVTVAAPTFTTSIDPPTGDFPLEIAFKNTTSWATKFQWDFGDGSEKITIENPTYTYKKNGNFIAKLIAGTSDGCTDTADVTVVITIPKSVFDKMPGVFSPNGDGQNDFYSLKSTSLEGINTLDCWIYSRWGVTVAEWHSIDDAVKGWDGNINGGPEASPGVYYYYIKAVGYDNQVYEKKGAFHLFR